MLAVQPTAMHVFDVERADLYVWQATNIDAPALGRRSGAPKRKNSTHGTKIVFRSFRIPLIERQVFQRRQRTEAAFLDAMNKRSSTATYGAVTYADVVKVRIDLEFHLSAMATAAIGRFHDV